MGKNYELKRVDEEVWKKTPIHIQELRRNFSFLRDEIAKRKKKIDKYQKLVKKLRTEKRNFERRRNLLYYQLYQFQLNNLPSVSPTQQKGNNYQWSINLKISDIIRKKYLGSDKKVRKRLDEIKDVLTYSSLGENYYYEDGHEIVKVEIKRIIEKNLVLEMESDLDGVFERWKNDELKMWDYFY